jgi:hypothetical protein
MLPSRQPDPPEEFPGSAGRTGLASKLKRNLNILLGSERGNQLESLKHETDLLTSKPRPLILVQSSQLLPVEVNRAGARPVQSGEESE